MRRNESVSYIEKESLKSRKGKLEKRELYSLARIK